MRFIYNFLIILFFSFIFVSCKPSYPTETLIKQTEQLIFKETSHESKVFFKDSTFFIYVNVDGINQDMTANDNVINTIQQVLLLATRVSLSTDAKIDFFNVIIANEKVGVLIIFKQYVDDVKKWFYGNIGRNDFFRRSLLETKFKNKSYVFNESDFPSIKMPEFILEQTIYRIKSIFNEEIDELKKQRLKLKKQEKKLEELDLKSRQYRSWTMLLENTLESKNYINFEGKGYYFQYKFKDFDKDNFLNIDYMGFYDMLIKTHKEVSDIYNFDKYFAIYINRGQDKVFEYNLKEI